MSALQYLNKKSWHTSTIKNNEKVWLREQEAAREQSRIEELQKQLAEERRQQQLLNLEEKSGRVDASAALKRRRLNWMYEFGRDDTPEDVEGRDEKEREDIMLGNKKINLNELGEEQRERRTLLIDDEAKMREDPLFLIELQRKKALALKETYKIVKLRAKNDEKARQKALRKEERRQIRKDRQRLREERALIKRDHDQKLTKKRKLDNDNTSNRSKDDSSHRSRGDFFNGEADYNPCHIRDNKSEQRHANEGFWKSAWPDDDLYDSNCPPGSSKSYQHPSRDDYCHGTQCRRLLSEDGHGHNETRLPLDMRRMRPRYFNRYKGGNHFNHSISKSSEERSWRPKPQERRPQYLYESNGGLHIESDYEKYSDGANSRDSNVSEFGRRCSRKTDVL